MAFQARVDSKGRISLPREVREMLGDVVQLEPIGKEKVVLSRSRTPRSPRGKKAKDQDFWKQFDREPRRTGKPENPSPEEMKAIWKE